MPASASKSKGKGKGKRHRSDDIPPELSDEQKHQQGCLVELQNHLVCQAHSRVGVKTYCWIDPAGPTGLGGHKPLNHMNMTIWAKHIVSRYYCKINNSLPSCRLSGGPQNISRQTIRNMTTHLRRNQGVGVRCLRSTSTSTSRRLQVQAALRCKVPIRCRIPRSCTQSWPPPLIHQRMFK